MIDQNSVLQFMRDRLEGYAVAQFPEFKPARHHRLLASKLEDVQQGRIKRLCVLMPPRHGKSRMSSELFPAWCLGRDPKRRILSLSYSQDLADVFGRSVRNYLRSPTFAALFPGCQLSSDSSSARRFNTTVGGGYVAIGVGGPTTGRGADLLLLDDLIKDREQADSQTYRESLIDWYRSVARTRLQPDGAIVLVQTRWGTSDFVSWLLQETQHEGWEVISLPAIALDSDPLGRQPGEALWSEAYPVEALEQTKETLGSRDWNALYQQCPIADSDVIFRQDWLRFYSKSPLQPHSLATFMDVGNPELEVIASWDLSFGGTKADSSWVVGQVWAYNRQSEYCYLLHQERQQMGFVDSVKVIAALNKQYQPDRTLIEAKANGVGVIEVLREAIPNLTAVEPKGGKEDRAYRVMPMFEAGKVWLPEPKLHPWVKPLLAELEVFPMGSSDDCIDSMTQALGFIQQRYQSGRWLRAYSPRDGDFFQAVRVF